MFDLTDLSNRVNDLAETRHRIIIAIAGAPGSGKSTFVGELKKTLSNVVVIPMDGFHLDNVILEERNFMSRKGSPDSFDAEGYYHLISRLKHSQETVYAPVFDRSSDHSRAGAIEIPNDIKIVLTEGNYLLLEQAPWSKLAELFDLSVFLDVPKAVLKERLVNRWLTHGLSDEAALKRAESNDLPNAEWVTESSMQADVVINNYSA